MHLPLFKEGGPSALHARLATGRDEQIGKVEILQSARSGVAVRRLSGWAAAASSRQRCGRNLVLASPRCREDFLAAAAHPPRPQRATPLPAEGKILPCRFAPPSTIGEPCRAGGPQSSKRGQVRLAAARGTRSPRVRASRSWPAVPAEGAGRDAAAAGRQQQEDATAAAHSQPAPVRPGGLHPDSGLWSKADPPTAGIISR